MDSKEFFAIYQQELIKWNKQINLVQNDSLENVWKRHFEDSLQLANLIPVGSQKIIDIGSGAGFPGLVLAIHLNQKITLVEPNLKKATFLHHVNNLYNSPAIVMHARWQGIEKKDFQVIVSRAFASLNNLLKAMFFVSRETKNALGLFLKGQKVAQEIEDAMQIWTFEYELIPSHTHTDGKIIKVMDLKRK